MSRLRGFPSEKSAASSKNTTASLPSRLMTACAERSSIPLAVQPAPSLSPSVTRCSPKWAPKTGGPAWEIANRELSIQVGSQKSCWPSVWSGKSSPVEPAGVQSAVS